MAASKIVDIPQRSGTSSSFPTVFESNDFTKKFFKNLEIGKQCKYEDVHMI